jgi:hypothetical protein
MLFEISGRNWKNHEEGWVTVVPVFCCADMVLRGKGNRFADQSDALMLTRRMPDGIGREFAQVDDCLKCKFSGFR